MTIEVTAKKVEDAIKQGLEQLGASFDDDFNVEVLEQGGLFRKAKVRLTIPDKEDKPEQKPAPAAKPEQNKEKKPAAPEVKPEQKSEKKPEQKSEKKPEKKPEQKAEQKSEKKAENKKPVQDGKAPEKPSQKEEQKSERPAKNSEEAKQATARAAEFVTELVKKMGFTEAAVEASDTGDIAITAPAGDDSLIIGRHGETLSAISFLAETLGRAEKQHVNIVADCNGYRERRAASLTAMANRRANECAAKRRKIKLEPMERIDRRTIHNALSGDDRVTTVSEGKEPYRYIVILPKK